MFIITAFGINDCFKIFVFQSDNIYLINQYHCIQITVHSVLCSSQTSDGLELISLL